MFLDVFVSFTRWNVQDGEKIKQHLNCFIFDEKIDMGTFVEWNFYDDLTFEQTHFLTNNFSSLFFCCLSCLFIIDFLTNYLQTPINSNFLLYIFIHNFFLYNLRPAQTSNLLSFPIDFEIAFWSTLECLRNLQIFRSCSVLKYVEMQANGKNKERKLI